MFVPPSYYTALSLARTASALLDKQTRTQEEAATLASATRTLPSLFNEAKGCQLDLSEIQTAIRRLTK